MMIDFYKIVTEAQESEDEFIFTTIQPFCEEVTKRKISKAELVKLLSQPKIVRCGECEHWHEIKPMEVWTDRLGKCDAPRNRFNHHAAYHEYFYCGDGERRTDAEKTD